MWGSKIEEALHPRLCPKLPGTSAIPPPSFLLKPYVCTLCLPFANWILTTAKTACSVGWLHPCSCSTVTCEQEVILDPPVGPRANRLHAVGKVVKVGLLETQCWVGENAQPHLVRTTQMERGGSPLSRERPEPEHQALLGDDSDGKNKATVHVGGSLPLLRWAGNVLLCGLYVCISSGLIVLNKYLMCVWQSAVRGSRQGRGRGARFDWKQVLKQVLGARRQGAPPLG